MPGRGEQARGADPEQHQPHVVGGRIGQQPLQVAAGRRVQGSEQGRQRAEGHDQKPPPCRSPAEQPVADPDDAVDPEVDHGRRHQGGHRTRGFGVGPGQPHVKRRHAGLRAEADHRQHEGAAPHPGGQVRRPGGNGGERLARRVGGQEDQADQQGGGAELGHHRVPLAGRAHLRAPPMIDEDEQERGDGHQLPQEQECGHVRRRRDQQQGGDEQREEARRCPAGKAMTVVTEAEDHGADPDDGADGDEHRTEAVEAPSRDR